MKLVDVSLPCVSRKDSYRFYAIGDIHLGARDCAESHVWRLIQKIKKDPNARWIGGGDYCECIKPNDKRFDEDTLAEWIIKKKEARKDIVFAQRKKAIQLFQPIISKCLGLIEGNHEAGLRIAHNTNHHGIMCDRLEVEDLTSEAFFRIRFKKDKVSRIVNLFICHGRGGGRTPGAEPNHLYRLANSWDADIVLRGHSHTYHILPPIVVLSLPKNGRLPQECQQKYKRVGNWGCWLKSYTTGPSTYVTRANYAPKPLSTLEIEIKPHVHEHISGPEQPNISMRELVV